MTARTPRHYFGVALRLLWSATRIAVRILAGMTSFLAASARTTPASDVLNSSVTGGELNFRSGKFDDGTDPAGIYDLE